MSNTIEIFIVILKAWKHKCCGSDSENIIGVFSSKDKAEHRIAESVYNSTPIVGFSIIVYDLNGVYKEHFIYDKNGIFIQPRVIEYD